MEERMSEIVTREEFDQYIELQKKICGKVVEISEQFAKCENTRNKTLKPQFTDFDFPIDVPPIFWNPSDRFLGFKKREWYKSNCFECTAREDEDILAYQLPISYLSMTSEEIYAEAVRINQNIEDKKNADTEKMKNTMLKSQYQTYLNLKAKFEKMPKERIEEINGGDDE